MSFLSSGGEQLLNRIWWEPPRPRVGDGSFRGEGFHAFGNVAARSWVRRERRHEDEEWRKKVVTEVPPEIIGEILRAAIHLPSPQDVEALVVE
jgi:hypothetical protein